MTVYEILNKIQVGLKAPKSQFNAFGKYHYRSCEDILEAVKPLLGGAIITISDDIIEHGGRFYIEATSTIMFDGQSVSCSAYAREEEERKGMSASQLTGATSSYARKYSLNGLLLIDDTKDADHNNQGENGKKDEGAKPAQPEKYESHKPKQSPLQERRLQIITNLKSLNYTSENIKDFILLKCGKAKTSDWKEEDVKLLEDAIEELQPPRGDSRALKEKHEPEKRMDN